LVINRDEDKSTNKKEDVRYIKDWKRKKIKEGHVNKEKVQDIVL
jgi:hypothetical protein